MKAIVTGATGFIGRHLVDSLAVAGGEVHCLTRGALPKEGRPSVRYHQADFTRSDLGLADDVFRDASVIYHLAGATRAVSAGAFRAANVEATERLADRLVSAGNRPRFILVSSQAAAGPARDAEHPRRESDPEAPIEDYGRSKLAAERAIRDRAAVLDATILRPVAVYGPGDRDFLSIFSMLKRGVAVYPGTRHASINTVFVKDLVAGILAAAKADVAVGRTYFLGDDAQQSWKEIYGSIGEAMGQTSPVEFKIPHGVVAIAGSIGDVVGSLAGKPPLVNSSKAMLAAPKYWLCSSAKAREDFAFTTPTSLREGMRVTYDWYLRHRWL